MVAGALHKNPVMNDIAWINYRLRGFVKALEAMSREQFDIAADEFMDSRWAKQVGNRAVEVTEMIRTGEYR